MLGSYHDFFLQNNTNAILWYHWRRYVEYACSYVPNIWSYVNKFSLDIRRNANESRLHLCILRKTKGQLVLSDIQAVDFWQAMRSIRMRQLRNGNQHYVPGETRLVSPSFKECCSFAFRPGQNSRHFADDISIHFLENMLCILILIVIKFVPKKGVIENESASISMRVFVQAISWTDDGPVHCDVYIGGESGISALMNFEMSNLYAYITLYSISSSGVTLQYHWWDTSCNVRYPRVSFQVHTWPRLL